VDIAREVSRRDAPSVDDLELVLFSPSTSDAIRHREELGRGGPARVSQNST
jgi:hypothetical protein